MSRITDPDFKWIPSQSHDADSTAFRKRQLERIAAANKAREEAAKIVRPIAINQKRKQG